MSVKYKYRFKTKEEFVKEFGERWMITVNWNEKGCMDYLFGTILETDFSDEYSLVKIPSPYFGCWYINRKMLVKKEIVPDYTPKKIIREI